jgi:CelD/BcsL family acetyltransferase involved in cellulose biosynthesis
LNRRARHYQGSTAEAELPARIEIIESPAELLEVSDRWEKLWRDSPTALPLVRPEFIESWCARFAPDSRMQILTVIDNERLVAALPLIGSSVRGLPEIGLLPNNVLSETGDFLICRDTDATRITNALATVIRDHLVWPLVIMRYVPYEQPRWQALVQALMRAGIALNLHRSQDVPVAELQGDFAQYRSHFSRNFRRNLRRRRKMIDANGGLELEILEDLDASDIAPLLREGFEIERRCWKGRQGSSVLQTPGEFDYYLREAQALAVRGELSLIFLVHGGRRIAFQYAYRAKGHYFLPKVGYDEEFSHYSPGHLLTEEMMRRFCQIDSSVRVDFHGELGPASTPWMTATYPAATIVLSNRTRLGGTLVGAFCLARFLRRNVRNAYRRGKHLTEKCRTRDTWR